MQCIQYFELTFQFRQNSVFYFSSKTNSQSVFQNRQKISFSAHVRRRLDCSASSYSVISVKKPIRSGNIIIGFEQFYRPVPEEVT